MPSSADPDQLASLEATDMDLHCLQESRAYLGPAGPGLTCNNDLDLRDIYYLLFKVNGSTFKGDNSYQNCFASFLNRGYSKRKESGPTGSRFF